MLVKTLLAANAEDEVLERSVVIPTNKLETFGEPLALAAGKFNAIQRRKILAYTFWYGQNDFQKVPGKPSVTVGDVACLPDGTNWRCCGAGWKQLPKNADPAGLRGDDARDAGKNWL